MIAGGSGITPMYQIIHSIINDEKDTTRVSVLLANKTESDILCYEELKVYAKLNKLNLFLTLDSVIICLKNFSHLMIGLTSKVLSLLTWFNKLLGR